MGMYKQFFDRLYHNAYGRGRRSGKEISITAHFIVKGEDKQVAKNQKFGVISELRTMAEFYQPEKIMIVVSSNGKKKVYEENFDTKLQSTVKDIQEISKIPQTPVNTMQPFQTDLKGFSGLGQISVEDYINKKLEDERKDRKLQELERELQMKTEEVGTLNETIRQLEAGIDEHEKEKDELEGILESKKNIRYWAGLTGDILESLGLEKSKLREPLAGLIASEDDGQQQQLQQGQSTQDDSGIVEDNPNQNKRDEVISLINDFLKTVDNPTLANVFMIFSEIEKDNNKAISILEQLNYQTQD